MGVFFISVVTLKLSSSQEVKFGAPSRSIDPSGIHADSPTKKKVNDYASRTTTEINDGLYASIKKATLNASAEKWKVKHLIGLKPTTKNGYLSNLEHHLIPAFGDLPLQAISTDMTTSWRAELLTAKKQKPKSVANLIPAQPVLWRQYRRWLPKNLTDAPPPPNRYGRGWTVDMSPTLA